MRFRYKVIMINIAFLSIALGILGFIIIHRNFKQTLEIQTSYAIEENNLIQAAIEYRLLDVVNGKNSNITAHLKDAGKETSLNLLSERSSLFILYNEKLVYSDEENPQEINAVSETLFSSLELGDKSYMLKKENNGYYLYVSTKNIINDRDLYIITKRDAQDSYQLLYNQIQYFFLLMIVVLGICSVFMYFISLHLTKPMEQLNAVTDYFANGNYQTRADIISDDEIGMLAEKFNNMAVSVSEHIEELNLMVKQHEQFVADFTHEIKTPMTTIIGYADTLRSKNMNEDRKKLAYQYIYSEGKRLETMSRKLFDLIYLKDSELVKTEISTSLLASEITDSMQPILSRKNILLKTDVAPAVIFGDRELLKTVFINLIDNARKASVENTSIFFRGFTENDLYIFQIEDSGCGMDEETVKHICDEFYMADKSRSREEGGAGLGMSLAALIIKKHNARLVIKSRLGSGTVISVIFDGFAASTTAMDGLSD